MSVNATEVHTLQIVIMQMGVGFLFYGVQAALTGAAVTFMARRDIRSRLVIAAVAGHQGTPRYYRDVFTTM
ncbi:hypothetical protein FB107DRAFT_274802 [Schizophyllum commune]